MERPGAPERMLLPKRLCPRLRQDGIHCSTSRPFGRADASDPRARRQPLSRGTPPDSHATGTAVADRGIGVRRMPTTRIQDQSASESRRAPAVRRCEPRRRRTDRRCARWRERSSHHLPLRDRPHLPQRALYGHGRRTSGSRRRHLCRPGRPRRAPAWNVPERGETITDFQPRGLRHQNQPSTGTLLLLPGSGWP